MKKILATTAFLVLTCSVIAAIGIDSVGDRPGTAYEDATPLQVICTTKTGNLGAKVVCVSQPQAGCVATACVAVTGTGTIGD